MPKVTDQPASADEGFRNRIQTAWRQSKYRDHTQKELSVLFEYSQQGISFILNGHRYPHLSQGIRIAKEFNVTLDWLYCGRLPMRPIDPSPFVDLGYRLMNLREGEIAALAWMIGMMENNQLDAEQLKKALMQYQSLDVNSLVNRQ